MKMCFLLSSPNVYRMVFSPLEVLYGSWLCAVAWRAVVNPLVAAGPKLSLLALLQNSRVFRKSGFLLPKG